MAESEIGTFDQQAPGYDTRAGLPTVVGAAVARAITAQADARADDLIVELGAGTGEIGVHLSRLPVQYVGLDNSPAMLEVFRTKVGDDSSSLIVADCNQTWPLPDGSATAVFASRVIHLLDAAHVVQETVRVCRPGGLLLLGRVLRDRDSIRERMRRQRQKLMVEAGMTPRRGEEGTRRVVEQYLAAGGEFIGRSEVVEWTGEITPAHVIAGWETLYRMGAVSVDSVTRADILDRIRHWARAELGDLDRPVAFRERYALDVVRLP